MSTERHYSEKEIAAIFEQATRAQEASSQANPNQKGLTLAELQAIGAASGITPEFIAQAAAAVNHKPRVAPPVRTLGMKVGVGRTVDLPGKLSDQAWELFVADVRETFQAQGKLQREGSLRQWTNGNLQVMVEPTATGERVRMKTINRNHQSIFIMGVVISLAFLVLSVAVFMEGDMQGFLVMLAPLLMALGMLGYSGFTLPGWAKTREEQMETLSTRAVALASMFPIPTDSAKAEPPVASAESATVTMTAEPTSATPLLDLGVDSESDPASTPATRNRMRS